MLSTNVLCMKKRKKRSYYVSNVSDYGSKYRINKSKKSSVGVGMMQITEDTPPDMLAGAMDLMLHLPDGRSTKMSVERSTPMMDVLVQITNTNHLQISGFVLQPLAMNCNDEKVLPYFPNTPIGTLDTQDIRVVAKNRPTATTLQRNATKPQQPFESTFRLKVHLPRNQLYVERVSMNAYLHEIKKNMCEEKNLDANKYELRHPANLDQILDLKLRLVDYQITEVYAVNKGSNRLTQVFSSSESIMAFRKDDERKQKSNNSGGGLFNFLKRGKVSNGSGSLSSDNRSISPTHSDDSRSVSPPVSAQPAKLVPAVVEKEKPKPPVRKRRPAPKPPSAENVVVETTTKLVENVSETEETACTMRKKEGLTICHSRNSSDSSGYHEASILSDNAANTSLPRKRPQTIIDSAHCKSTSNLTTMKVQSKSTSSLAFPSRNKKKAPPPPPGIKCASSVANLENASPVVASPIDDDAKLKQEESNTKKHNEDVSVSYATNSPPESIVSSLATALSSSNIETDIGSNIKEKPVPDDNDEFHQSAHKAVQLESAPETNEAPTEMAKVCIEEVAVVPLRQQVEAVAEVPQEDKSVVVVVVDSSDWEYQLPSPPTAFRDSSPQPTTTDSETISDMHPSTADSILTNPNLFEKLNVLSESQTEVRSSTKSIDSVDDNKFISSLLSLENLEKRKKLVYNRELATSLKYDEHDADESAASSKRSSATTTTLLNELEEVLAKPTTPAPPPVESNNANTNWNKVKAQVENFSAARRDSTLPNFKITTYDIPKQKINIFEDDSISSNVIAASVVEEETVEMAKPRQEFNKHRCMTLNREFLQRSESFNTWMPSVPVKRSKSQVAIKPEVVRREEEPLQSIEVMKAIRTTLTTTNTTPTVKTAVLPTTDEVDATMVVPTKEPPVVTPKEDKRRPVSLYGTPCINLTSWKERELTNQRISSTPINKTLTPTHPAITSNAVNNVSIKVNGSEAISQQSGGNVLIKIQGHQQSKPQDELTKRFINHTTAVGYRRPLGNINKVERRAAAGRPHSIAFENYQYDASRLPIVRSVELKKKTFKDGMNTSVTQIRPEHQDYNQNVGKVNVSVNGGGRVNLFENVVLRNAANSRRAANERVNRVTNSSVDQRGQLLDDIRNFGGKKGLKTLTVKV